MNASWNSCLVLLTLTVASLPSSATAQKMTSAPGTTNTAAMPTLNVGSKAPPLDVAHWLEPDGLTVEPVTTFLPGKVYVVEFWATTCGPCVAGMPHLSELQSRFGDDLRILCISDEEPEVVESFLDGAIGDSNEPFRQSVLNLAIAADPDRSTYEAFMDAAGEPGIPTSFIVGRTGRIEWIGHAGKIDGPLTDVIEGRWDRRTFTTAYAAQKQVRDAYYLGAIDKRFNEARQQLRQIRKSTDSRDIELLVNKYLDILDISEVNRAVGDNDARAPVLIREHFKEKDAEAAIRWLTQMARFAEHRQFSPRTLDAIIALARETIETSPDSAELYRSLAQLLARAGRLEQAIDAQEAAVTASRKAAAEFERELELLRERQDASDTSHQP